MNKFINILILCCILQTNISAQYSIDLKKVGSPAVSEHLIMGNPGPAGKEIYVNNLYMTIGGKPVLPVMGEFHFSRYDHRFWKDALLKMKSSGINIVATYVLWNYHEEIEGRLNWTGNNNLREFITLCGELDLLVHLRCGPYCNAETRNGGLPAWLQEKGAKPRTNDPLYLAYARKWYHDVYSQVKGLLYKDNGPVMGLQLENEFVTQDLLLSHMLTLKKTAVEEGFDVPIYSMTHWMAVDFPKGEIIPYAGYYIETPWVNSGKKELPISNFQFFNYNRISDNIGTDIIKSTGNTESLIGGDNNSPYFTCEVGVGTPTFYNRRAIVPGEMAGANINLRLGCGVNLMGYYMYVGGTNRIGQMTTMESSGGRVSYDYQAPIREFGNLGLVMNETKKFNYFMNDFGPQLVPAIAYLPKSNKDTANLQWAVRLNKNDGFLFCSNYLYKHPRKEYKNVQFNIQLQHQMLTIPRRPVTVKNGAYFFWPFNQLLGGVDLKYTTNQPVCNHLKDGKETFFFSADPNIPSEYLIGDENIKSIQCENGKVSREKKQYFVDQLIPGRECIIEIVKTDGKTVRLVTLNEEESRLVWKGQFKGKDFVAFSRSGIICHDEYITLADESNEQDIWVYESDKTDTKHKVQTAGYYTRYTFEDKKEPLISGVRKLSPMDGAFWITNKEGNVLRKTFDGTAFSKAASVILRCKSMNGDIACRFNEAVVPLIHKGNYYEVELTKLYVNGKNTICFESQQNMQVIAEAEVILENGTRWTWKTDQTWITTGTRPAEVVGRPGVAGSPMIEWNGDETLACYEITTPYLNDYQPEIRLNIGFTGDWADAFIGGQLVNDFLFDGSDWIIGINRYHDLLQSNPLLLRIRGFNTEDPPIYFEKGTSLESCMKPQIRHAHIKKEYRFDLE